MPKGVYKRTELHRKIMSESHKGQIAWNKGIKGIHLNPAYEFKKGHISYWKDRNIPDEIKKKMSIAHKGKTTWMKGKTHSEETRNRISESKKGSIPWNKGKKTGLIPKTAFQKGMETWNKGTKGIMKAWNKDKKCPQLSEERNPNWKGGVRISKSQVSLLQPFHPFCTKDGYIRRSRLVMEKIIGRFLKPEEIVHHKNKNTMDDRPENLQLFPNHSKHMKFHQKIRNKIR